MPDGVVLLGDHYRPAGADGPLPVVLVRSPVRPGRAGRLRVRRAAGPARLPGVHPERCAGTFGSGGQFRPFLPEREDGLATVAWLREQPWCDGRVAMTGGSYLGHTQWAVAPYADPPLRSVSLNITAGASSRAAFYQHGAPSLHNALGWTGADRPAGARPGRPGAAARGSGPGLRRALRRVPLQAADVAVAGAPVPFWRDFVQHAEPATTSGPTIDHDADLAALPAGQHGDRLVGPVPARPAARLRGAPGGRGAGPADRSGPGCTASPPSCAR